jgi:serine/threonine protein kinase
MKKVNYKLKLEEAASFICQLVVGVNFLHSHKIMHLFLNTTDIYYYTNDILKIGGFYNFEVNKADKKSSNKRNLFYNCPKAELEQVDFKYDNW